MTPIFRPGPGPYALALAMTGVQLGERLLVVGAGTPAMFGALATKVGLSGRAVAVAEGEAAIAALEGAGVKAGVLVEVSQVRSGGELPFNADAFDLIVFDNTADALDKNAPWVGEAYRVLRAGGRAIVAERYGASGFRAIFLGGPTPSGKRDAAIALLQGHGFRPVRTIAERGGWRFTEGMKPRV